MSVLFLKKVLCCLRSVPMPLLLSLLAICLNCKSKKGSCFEVLICAVIHMVALLLLKCCLVRSTIAVNAPKEGWYILYLACWMLLSFNCSAFPGWVWALQDFSCLGDLCDASMGMHIPKPHHCRLWSYKPAGLEHEREVSKRALSAPGKGTADPKSLKAVVSGG